VGGNGIIAATVDGTVILNGQAVAQGKTVIFTATPNTTYMVSEWTVNGSVQGHLATTHSLTLTENVNVTVAFALQPANTYIVNFAVLGGNGTIAATVDGIAIINGQSVAQGKIVIFTATPNATYMVSEWTVNGSIQGHLATTHSLLLSENVNVTVAFALQPANTHIVNFAVVGGNGIIAATVDGTAILNGQAVAQGKTVIFTATPNTTYMVSEWTVNGSVQGHLATTHSLTLTENVNVTVAFALQPANTYIVNFAVLNGNGTIAATVDGTAILNGQAVTQGKTVAFTATPNSNYKVKDWNVNSNLQQNQTSNNFTLTLNESVNVTVSFILDEGENAVPLANDDARGTEYETAVIVDVLSNDTGLEDTPISVSISTVPVVGEGTAIVNGDNTITFTPAADFSGIAVFEYTVRDTNGDADNAQVTITVLPEGVTNHIPVANDDAAETEMNTTVVINVLANDTGLEDGFGSITIHAAPSNGSVTVNANRTISYTPSAWYTGADQFIYRLSDIHGDNDLATVSVNVVEVLDHTPVANDDALATEFEKPVDINALDNDSGLEDIPITITIPALPKGIKGTAIVNPDNTIKFTPLAGFSGTFTFRYIITDRDGDSDDANITVTVLPEGVTNHIPVANADIANTIVNTAVDINILANDAGLEDGFGSISISANPKFGSVTVNANRTITYTPGAWFVGNDSFIYRLADIHGDNDTALVTINITERPSAIPVANDDKRGASFNTPVTVDVLINDTGLEDEPIRVTIETIPDPLKGTAVVNADNTILFTPATGYIGFAAFQYRVEDKDGEWDTAIVTINVKAGINFVPAAVDDNAVTTENTAVNVNILANDSDLDDGIGEVTVFSMPQHGSIIVNADYSITYTPSAWYVGSDVFEYMIADLDGDYDIASVTITINSLTNYIPVAVNDSRGTSLNTAVIVDVLFNDSGLNDGGIAVTVVTNPLHGSIIVNADNTVTYTPTSGYLGDDEFEYRVADIDDDCDTAVATIHVKEINYNPVAVDDKYYTNTNTSKVLSILDNDSGLEDGGIKIEILISPMVGAVIVNTDNTVTYTPFTGFVGVDNFTYKVSDIDGDYDVATVTIGVMNGTLPDVTVSYSGHTAEDGSSVAVSFVLTVAPVNDVSLDLLSHDETEGVLSDTRITFTSANWSTPKVIRVTGVDDHIIDGDVSYIINTGNMVSSDPVYNLLNVSNIDLINDDNDVAQVILSIDDYTTSEDEKETEFTLVLSSEPESDVTINISSSDESEGTLDVESVTFTPANWNITQTITVSGVDDNLKDGDIQYELSFTVTSVDNNYNQFNLANLQLTNIDNDGRYGLVIPEAFSPDNDGYNDKFEILGLEKYNRVSIKVYNRWGNLVYSNTNYQNNWDGKANATMAVGQELPTGTYFYILTIRDKDKEISGSIFIKR
jgi:large repetitive protein